MKKLSDLFHLCAYDIKYQTVGHDVNYAFLEEKDTLYIFFQGSNSTTDWIRNFLFKKKPYKDMKIPYRVHRGFLAAWKEVEDIVIQKITDCTYRSVKIAGEKRAKLTKVYKYNHIVVVGYSHGGALAAFCHECVWYWRPDLRKDGFEGYGFEAPRIYGGFRVKDSLKDRWQRFLVIRTNNDLVTHCPPAIFRFCHVGDMIKIQGDTSLVKDKWIPRCIKSHFPEVVYDALVKYESK